MAELDAGEAQALEVIVAPGGAAALVVLPHTRRDDVGRRRIRHA